MSSSGMTVGRAPFVHCGERKPRPRPADVLAMASPIAQWNEKAAVLFLSCCCLLLQPTPRERARGDPRDRRRVCADEAQPHAPVKAGRCGVQVGLPEPARVPVAALPILEAAESPVARRADLSPVAQPKEHTNKRRTQNKQTMPNKELRGTATTAGAPPGAGGTSTYLPEACKRAPPPPPTRGRRWRPGPGAAGRRPRLRTTPARPSPPRRRRPAPRRRRPYGRGSSRRPGRPRRRARPSASCRCTGRRPRTCRGPRTSSRWPPQSLNGTKEPLFCCFLLLFSSFSLRGAAGWRPRSWPRVGPRPAARRPPAAGKATRPSPRGPPRGRRLVEASAVGPHDARPVHGLDQVALAVAPLGPRPRDVHRVEEHHAKWEQNPRPYREYAFSIVDPTQPR